MTELKITELAEIAAQPDRRTYIGGSDAAAILGLNPWKTPLDCYIAKTEGETAITDPARLRVLERGKRLEPYVLDMLADETGIEIVRRNRRYTHPQFDYIKAEIDAEAQTGENIEVKTVHPRAAWQWGDEGSDEIPLHYFAQVQHGLMVTGNDLCIVAALIGADDLRTYRVNRDDEAIGAMREREQAFWARVQERRPPDPVNTADVRRMFCKDTGQSVEATEPIADDWLILESLREIIALKKQEADAIEERIKLFMGGASELTYQDRALATWKTSPVRYFDQRAFCAAHPGLYEQFKTLSDRRFFRMKHARKAP